MSLGNMYAGVRIVGRADSWYESDDDSSWEQACEFVAEWINENTTIPDTSVDDVTIEAIAELYLADNDYLSDALALSLQESWNEYCETNHELGKPR